MIASRLKGDDLSAFLRPVGQIAHASDDRSLDQIFFFESPRLATGRAGPDLGPFFDQLLQHLSEMVVSGRDLLTRLGDPDGVSQKEDVDMGLDRQKRLGQPKRVPALFRSIGGFLNDHCDGIHHFSPFSSLFSAFIAMNAPAPGSVFSPTVSKKW